MVDHPGDPLERPVAQVDDRGRHHELEVPRGVAVLQRLRAAERTHALLGELVRSEPLVALFTPGHVAPVLRGYCGLGSTRLASPASPSAPPTPVGALGPNPQLDRRRSQFEPLPQSPFDIPEVGGLEAPVGEQREGRGIAGPLHRVLAVSYTHLTLPTK